MQNHSFSLTDSFNSVDSIKDQQLLLSFKRDEILRKWELISSKLAVVERQKIVETRPEEVFRLDQIVQQIKDDRLQLEQELEQLEAQTGSFKSEHTPKVQVSRLPRTDSKLIGREEELGLLDQAWHDTQVKVFVLKAVGGSGKTALMQAWLDQLSTDNYCGAENIYTWSFYSQGASEDRHVSADEFFTDCFDWLGYDIGFTSSPHDRGVKLAELVCQQRTLLLLDGLEPLQYPLGGVMNGALRDKGLASLFLQLAAQNNGLLLISSRQPVMELNGRPSVVTHELLPLSAEAGVTLLRSIGVHGDKNELAATVDAYKGHALSLSLLAEYLCEYEQSDIRQQDSLAVLTDFPEESWASRHAFKVMAAYENQLADTSDLQILYSMGLFDRPVSINAMKVLFDAENFEPNNPLKDDRVFRAASKRLRRLGLLNTPNPEQSDNLDTHPLVRQYFGKRLAELHPSTWQQAHKCLYEYFKSIPEKEQPDTLEEMEPLFAAVRHGCSAGMYQEVIDEVYYPRIERDGEYFLTKKLGAFGVELSIIANFFVGKKIISPPKVIDEDTAVTLLGVASYCLRALGRIQEAIQPTQSAMEMRVKQQSWKRAAIFAHNLAELHLMLGEVNLALNDSKHALQYANESEDSFQIFLRLTSLAVTYHQAGKLDKGSL